MITLDGKKLHEINPNLMVLRDHQDPLLPQTVDRTIEIPGRHGAYYFDADLGPKTFRIPIGIKTQKSRNELQQAVRDVATFFLDQTGKPREIALRFDYEPEKEYIVRYSGNLPIERLFRVGRFTLPLTAFDPYAYADMNAYDPTEDYQYDSGYKYDSGLMYDNPMGVEWRYFRHYSSVYNYAPYETPLIVVIEGSVGSPNIINRTTGQKFSIGRTFENKKIYIDGHHFLVFETETDSETFFLSANYPAEYKDEIIQGSLMPYQKGPYVMLAPGKNDLVFQGVQPNAQVNFYWKHRFL